MCDLILQIYGWNADKVIRFYVAGATHDIGKVVIGNHILEKPGKLDEWEYSVMKDHARATLDILSNIDGLEDITEWASNHHEKLDGTGYSRGMNGSDLSFEERLMACIDIYQALTEDRHYKAGLSHAKTIAIM
ncbi:MAG: HD domain-containing protein, partial [Firmicutes bacterium]|nr:HD domain-containing protein [Bacillota bacterium]